MYVCVSANLLVCMPTCTNVWMHRCKDVCYHVCTHVFMYVCMHLCMYVCVYMSMAECICMHECRQFEPKQLNNLPTNEIGIVANPMLTSKSIAQLQSTTMSDFIIEQEEVCEDWHFSALKCLVSRSCRALKCQSSHTSSCSIIKKCQI